MLDDESMTERACCIRIPTPPLIIDPPSISSLLPDFDGGDRLCRIAWVALLTLKVYV
jgi:hypothetical protein